MKRLIALLMAVLVTLGSVVTVDVITVSAADDRRLNLLSSLGLMDGDEVTGNFWNDAPVKRYEIAKILYNMFGFEGSLSETRKFTDVEDEDRLYVETIVQYGIMNGYDEKTFGPEDYITNDQLVKIFVDIIGGKELASVFGGFPIGYREAGRKLHMYNSLTGGGDAAARRIDVANMIYEALHMDMVKVASYSSNDITNYFIANGHNFLGEQLDIEIVEGIVKQIDSTAFNKPVGARDGYVKIGDTVIEDPDFKADKFLGCSVIAYVKVPENMNTRKLIHIEGSNDNTIIEINGEDYAGSNDGNISYYVGDRVRKMAKTSVTDMVYNGVSVEYDESYLKQSSDMSIKLIDNNDDGKCDLVNIFEYKNYVIEKYIAEEEMLYLKYSERPISLKDVYLRMYCDGELVGKDDIIDGCVVSVAVSSNASGDKAITLRLSTESVIGTIESTSRNNSELNVVIAGTEYKVNKYAEELSSKGKITDIASGLNGQFFLNENKEIVNITGTTNVGDVGFLYGVGTDGAFNDTIKFKIYTLAGKFEIFEQSRKLRVNGKSMNVDDFIASGEFTTLMNDVVKKQLVKYKVDEGIIKEINFCSAFDPDVDSYDEQAFSLDAAYESGTRMKRTNVFDDKYLLTADTKVFYVPSDLTDDESDYAIYTNSHFSATKTYNVWLYDVSKNGKVSYVLEKWNVGASNIGVSSGLMIVESLGQCLNSQGEEAYFVEGYSDKGGLFQLVVPTDAKMYSTSNSGHRVSIGDVIQYSTNIAGEVQALDVVGEVNSTSYYGSMTPHNNDEEFVKRHGFATNIDGSGLLLTVTQTLDEIKPTEAEAYINASGGTVYMYHKDREIVEKSNFSDIVQGDRIFAITNRANSTRILVIYRGGDE